MNATEPRILRQPNQPLIGVQPTLMVCVRSQAAPFPVTHDSQGIFTISSMFGWSVISVRRFCFRPTGVLLSAIGSLSE